MYRFNELSTRAQLISIGLFIKEFKRRCPNEDMTIEAARKLIETRKTPIAFTAKGSLVTYEQLEGLYIRQVPSTGTWHYYLFYKGKLNILADYLDGKGNPKWCYSLHKVPFKSEGFKKVKL